MSQVIVRRAPESTLLVKFADVKTLLGITGSTQDALLTQFITEASDLVTRYCGRSFGRQLVTEKIGVDLGGFGQHGTHRLMLSCLPLLDVSEIRYYDEPIDLEEVDMEDPEAGFIFSEQGFASTSMLVQNIEVSGNGQLSPKWEVDYSAGYILPTFTAVSLTLTNASYNTTTGVITSATAHGLVVGDTVRASVTGGATLASCFVDYRDYFVKTTPSTTTFTLTDEVGGDAITLTDDGSGNTTMARQVTLPASVSGAVFELVTSRYRNKGRDKSVTSERLGDWSASYSTNSIPAAIMETLSPFRRMD